jgi:hypothetical protein
MNISAQMPAVIQCEINDCAYNAESRCHAKAITIGDSVTPSCDTVLCNSGAVRSIEARAGVGACKVNGCRYNEDLECTADGIMVGPADGGIRCLTYMAR